MKIRTKSVCVVYVNGLFPSLPRPLMLSRCLTLSKGETFDAIELTKGYVKIILPTLADDLVAWGRPEDFEVLEGADGRENTDNPDPDS